MFKIDALNTGQQMKPKRICRTVSKIGEKAGVIVETNYRPLKRKKPEAPEAEEKPTKKKKKPVERPDVKYASAHDLRRAFGTRWAPKLKPVMLQQLMRHRSIGTTLKYYVAMDADDVSDVLWRKHTCQENSRDPAAQQTQ